MIRLSVFFLVLLSATSSLAKPKIGVVNVREVYIQYIGVLGIEQSFHSQLKALEKNPRFQAVSETDTRLKQLSTTLRDQETNEETRQLAAKEFSLLSDEFTALSGELRDFFSQEQVRLTAEKVVLIEKALSNLRTAIEEVSQEQGLDHVFDLSGRTSSQTSPIIYLRSGVDLTPLVLERLDIERLKKSAK